MITSVQDGLEPDVISNWYRAIESEVKARCPTEELRDSIEVVQNLVLPMKFEFKSSKRAIPYVVAAIEDNLEEMPFATRLYFEKLGRYAGNCHSVFNTSRSCQSSSSSQITNLS